MYNAPSLDGAPAFRYGISVRTGFGRHVTGRVIAIAATHCIRCCVHKVLRRVRSHVSSGYYGGDSRNPTQSGSYPDESRTRRAMRYPHVVLFFSRQLSTPRSDPATTGQQRIKRSGIPINVTRRYSPSRLWSRGHYDWLVTGPHTSSGSIGCRLPERVAPHVAAAGDRKGTHKTVGVTSRNFRSERYRRSAFLRDRPGGKDGTEGGAGDRSVSATDRRPGRLRISRSIRTRIRTCR